MLNGWKMLIVGLATTVFGFLETFDFTSVLSNPKTAALVVTAIGVVNTGLRFVTKSPIFGK
jgi:hypothetical protein